MVRVECKSGSVWVCVKNLGRLSRACAEIIWLPKLKIEYPSVSFRVVELHETEGWKD